MSELHDKIRSFVTGNGSPQEVADAVIGMVHKDESNLSVYAKLKLCRDALEDIEARCDGYSWERARNVLRKI